jgi:hypothetical protein
MSLVEIRGYATRFLEAERFDTGLEFFEATSFDDQIARNDSVFLNFDDHDAPSICRPLQMFADEFGLGFSGWIQAAKWKSIRPWVLTTHNFASVNIVIEASNWELLNGERCRRITKARCDHVTISDEQAVYKGTGVWPADVVGDMPLRLARLATEWERGRAQSRPIIDALRRGAAQKRSRIASSTSRPIEASRMKQLAAFRTKMAGAIAAGLGNGDIICHAGFSRAGGFDAQEFDAMVMRAGRSR